MVYVGIIAIILFLAEFFKSNGVLIKLLSKIKNKKLRICMLHFISGVLPMPGRICVVNSIFDVAIKRNTKSNPKLSFLHYLSTHHYYLWSPLEKTIIIPITVLGLSYFNMITLMLPLLIYTAVIYGIMIYKLDIDLINFEDSIEFKKTKFSLRNIDWKLICMVAVLILLGNYFKTYLPDIKAFLSVNLDLCICLPFLFISNFFLGSSGKYIGLVSMLTLLLGIEYFLPLFIIGYCAYYISPMHKCNPINIKYFNIKIIEYYKYLVLFIMPILIYALCHIFYLQQ